jgi:hypothetical protein
MRRRCFETAGPGVTVRQPAGGTASGCETTGATLNQALVLLGLAWATMLVPAAVRARNGSPQVTIEGFERAMDVLRSETRSGGGRSAVPGRRVLVPRDAERIVERPVETRPVTRVRRSPRGDGRMAVRRAWFERLLALLVLSLAVAVFVGGWAWVGVGLVAVVTVSYAVLLRRLKLQRDQARRVLRSLRSETPTAVLDAEPGIADPAPTFDAAADGAADAAGRRRRWDD